jgi:hypothetical protein
MASMVGYLDVDPLVRRVKSSGMINKLLQNICTAEGISKAGVKAELQARLIESRPFSNFLVILHVVSPQLFHALALGAISSFSG